eukprot:jgi/Botrbrau1/6344/Bobra.0098s0003.1
MRNNAHTLKTGFSYFKASMNVHSVSLDVLAPYVLQLLRFDSELVTGVAEGQTARTPVSSVNLA